MTPSLIPEPRNMIVRGGHFTVADGTAVLCATGDDDCLWIANYLADLVKRSRGLTLTVGTGDVSAAPHGAIVLRRTAASPNKESYSLDVAPDGIVVSSGTRAGLFYGGITLWQLLTKNESKVDHVDISTMHIDDQPRFAWRGLMLRFRAPFPVARIREVVYRRDGAAQTQRPAMASDRRSGLAAADQEISKAHERWRLARAGGHAAAMDIDPATGKPRLYGGFYTQDEVRDIVAYAQTAQRDHRARDRNARSCDGGDRGLSAARLPGSPADGGFERLGRFPLSLQCR